MKKTIIIIAIVIAVLVAVGVFFAMNNKETSNVENNNVSENTVSTQISYETTEDMENLITKIYEESKNDLPALETRELDLEDMDNITFYTGLQSVDGVEKVVMSESMITARAYSLFLVKTAENTNTQEIMQSMVDNVDMRRWICVSADVVYATNYGNLIFMVMSSEDLAKPEYDAFKTLVGESNIGKELVREVEELEF